VGLIGGSLGMGIKRAAPRTRVLGLGRDAARLGRAREMGAIDAFELDGLQALRDCDLVILATPIEHILRVLESLGNYLAPGAVVTDAGSTKRRICSLAWDRLPSTVEFIGGHPVAGREVTGVENSLSTLFENAPYVLCPGPRSAPENLSRLRSLVGLLGARPVIMTPDDHDRAIARVSHLPQLLSTVLANFTDVKDAEIAGSGLRDMLRLAGSSYSVWKGIFDTNPDNIESALEDFVRHLQAARGGLRDGSLSAHFENAQARYRKFNPFKS
jgi:prephenate dehydrogenase